MARTLSGESRVTVLPLLHTWPDRYDVIAYATTGDFGQTAVIGRLPVPQLPDVALMDIAARHQPTRVYGSSGGSAFAEACWLICVGWSGRSVPKPRTLEFQAASWSLELDRTTELKQPMYGHDRLHVGRFTLNDPALMEQAESLLHEESTHVPRATVV
ncbi:hypothetical protein ACFV0C_09550 [Streptomyces sp. NPDC059568]|uniref:hypothetical protein n=1 Tax=unclassified Streptomyces TaxID=2593676 RepID=UPI003660E44F